MNEDDARVVFQLRTPILSVVPALVATLALAAAVWALTGL